MSESEKLDEKFWEKMRGRALIIVGGNKLSRGITIEGLMSSFFLKYTQVLAYDTLLQAGRWFGYRNGYRDLCRLYLGPQQVFRLFKYLFSVEDEVRDQISRMDDRMENAQGGKVQTPKDVQLWVREKYGARITARAKMGSGSFETTTSYWGSSATFTNYSSNSSFIKNNLDALGSLLENIREKRVEGDSITTGYLFEGVAKEDILGFLSEYQEPQYSGTDRTLSLKYALDSAAYSEYAKTWRVYVANPNSDSTLKRKLFHESAEYINCAIRRTISSVDQFEETFKIQALSSESERLIDYRRWCQLDDSLPDHKTLTFKSPEVLKARKARKDEALLIINLFDCAGANGVAHDVIDEDGEKHKQPLVGLTYVLPPSTQDDSDLHQSIITTENQALLQE